jgi:hypothetical protein
MGVETGVRRWEREDGALFCCELKTHIRSLITDKLYWGNCGDSTLAAAESLNKLSPVKLRN